MIGEQPIAVGVNKDVPAKNVAELIALANKTQDGMLFGATNRGGQAHLTGELFRDRSKANVSFVHAAGAAVSLNDVIAGRMPIMFEGLAGLKPGIQSGDVRVLGVASPSACPTCRTCRRSKETVPGVVSSGWIVLMAPAGTPDRDHPEGQCRPAQGDGDAGRDRALPRSSAPIAAISRRRRPRNSSAAKRSCGIRSCAI